MAPSRLRRQRQSTKRTKRGSCAPLKDASPPVVPDRLPLGDVGARQSHSACDEGPQTPAVRIDERGEEAQGTDRDNRSQRWTRITRFEAGRRRPDAQNSQAHDPPAMKVRPQGEQYRQCEDPPAAASRLPREQHATEHCQKQQRKQLRPHGTGDAQRSPHRERQRESSKCRGRRTDRAGDEVKRRARKDGFQRQQAESTARAIRDRHDEFAEPLVVRPGSVLGERVRIGGGQHPLGE